MKTLIFGVVIALFLAPVAAGAQTTSAKKFPMLGVRGNNYVCHAAPMGMKPVKLALKDQFGGYRAYAYDLVFLCNPAAKRGKGHNAKIVAPRLHLACYKLRVANHKPRPWAVRMWNQFFPKGRNLRGKSRPRMLCVPTMKKRLK